MHKFHINGIIFMLSLIKNVKYITIQNFKTYDYCQEKGIMLLSGKLNKVLIYW